MKRLPVYAAALVPALIADIAAILALLFVFPGVAERFKDPSGSNALLLSLGFLLFCFAVYWLRRLKPAAGGEEDWASRRWRAGLAIFFALTMSLAIAWQLGFFESGLEVDTRDLGEGGSAVYFVFAPGAWLGFAMIYVLVLAFSVTPRIETSNRWRSLGAGLSLLAVNGMLLLLVAQASALFAGQTLFWLPLLFIWFVGLFAPPRLLYAARMADQDSPTRFWLLGALVIVLIAATVRIVSPL